MLIPLGTDRPLSRPTVVTWVLILVNAAIFVGERMVARVQPDLIARFHEATVLDPRDPHMWTFLTYAFLHGNFMHILGNLIFLWVFGPNVEDRFGRLGFLIFYLLGGIAAGVLHSAVYPNPVVGASGAIAAVTGAYLVLFPHTRIKTLLIFFLIGIFNIPAVWFIGFRIAWDLFSEVLGVSGMVATLAHLGGYGFGIGVSLLLLWTGLLSREPYDLFSITRHRRRRRLFRAAGRIAGRNGGRGEQAPVMHDQGPRPDEAQAEAIATARAQVATHFAEQNFDAAADAYRNLLERYAALPGAALLNRRLQYDLANHLFQTGDYQTAAAAYELFLSGYPKDSEAPHVHLILGLINARYLNDPVRAKQEVAAALEGLGAGPQQDMARELLEELG